MKSGIKPPSEIQMKLKKADRLSAFFRHKKAGNQFVELARLVYNISSKNMKQK